MRFSDIIKSFRIDKVEISSKDYTSYNPKQLSEAFRLEASLLNIPHRIQVVNSKNFSDQVVLNLTESAISADSYFGGGYIIA
ncbi:MAG TPA: hypothetical protein DCP78_06230 [Sphingobacterium sp.]|nr:hypothetical protein [Sphingobacterium sp.]